VTAQRESSEHVQDNSYSVEDEDRSVYKKFYADDDRNFDDDADDVSTGDWPRRRGSPAPDRPTRDYEDGTNSFDRRPT